MAVAEAMCNCAWGRWVDDGVLLAACAVASCQLTVGPSGFCLLSDRYRVYSRHRPTSQRYQDISPPYLNISPAKNCGRTAKTTTPISPNPESLTVAGGEIGSGKMGGQTPSTSDRFRRCPPKVLGRETSKGAKCP